MNALEHALLVFACHYALLSILTVVVVATHSLANHIHFQPHVSTVPIEIMHLTMRHPRHWVVSTDLWDPRLSHLDENQQR